MEILQLRHILPFLEFCAVSGRLDKSKFTGPQALRLVILSGDLEPQFFILFFQMIDSFPKGSNNCLD